MVDRWAFSPDASAKLKIRSSCARRETPPWTAHQCRPAAEIKPPALAATARGTNLRQPSTSTIQVEVTARNGSGTVSRPFHRVPHNTPYTREKNDEPGSGALVESEGKASRRSRRGYFPELVCPHGPRADRGQHGAPVGADALPQELDPVALHRPRSGLLAGREHRHPEDRCHRAQRHDPHRAAQGQTARDHRAPSRSAGRAARHRRASRRLCPGLHRTRCARRVAARSAADLREFRHRPLEHTGACRREASGVGRAAASR